MENTKMHEGSASLIRGQSVVVRIASLTPTGAGISKDFGRPIFVERVAPGDLAEVELFDVRKDFAKGKLVKLIESSPQRAEPPCPLFKVCGGCQWQHLSYEAQLLSKTDIVKQAVQHIGGQDPALVRDTIGAQEPLHYRNKVQFPVRNPKGSQRILAGYFKQDSHELVNIKFCPVQPAPLDRMLETVKEACERAQIWAYDERTGKGSLRHINARYSFSHNEVLVTLVINMKAKTEEEFAKSPLGKRLYDMARQIMESDREIVGVCANLNSEPGNRILGEQTICLSGKDFVEETLKTSREDYPALLREGLHFRLSPTSFFQVNTMQAVTLLDQIYDRVKEAVAGVEKPVIVDAFAGVGTIALWLSPLAASVYAIEEHAPAIADGEQNAALNGVSNVQFLHGTVETALPQLRAQGLVPDVIVLDPPRKGLSQEVLRALLDFEAATLVYVSCNPATLARDLKILQPSDQNRPNGPTIGYKTKQIQPVDLFPQTYHVESVTTLERFSSHGAVGNMEET